MRITTTRRFIVLGTVGMVAMVLMVTLRRHEYWMTSYVISPAGPKNASDCRSNGELTDIKAFNDTFRPTAAASSIDPCQADNITLVSAFLDIGDHKKGTERRKMENYFAWSKAFGRIHTRLFLYTDSRKFSEYFQALRSRLRPELTHIFYVNGTSQWPHGLMDTITQLYKNSKYPKFHPNTVVPQYSCAMHMKYAFLLDAILKRMDLVPSQVYMWVDVGYFRGLMDMEEYCIRLPRDLPKNKVTFNEVYKPNFNHSTKDIFYGNHVWVGGGMFIATRDTMVTFCGEYRRAAEFFLFRRNLSSTDQQCLYASYTNEGRRDVDLSVEIHVIPGKKDWSELPGDREFLNFPGNKEWFHLGFSTLYNLSNGTIQNSTSPATLSTPSSSTHH